MRGASEKWEKLYDCIVTDIFHEATKQCEFLKNLDAFAVTGW